MQASAHAGLQGRRILVVEDTLLVAELIVEHLESLGCLIVGPAARLAAAVAFARTEALDGALLDVNLAGYTSIPVADLLIERRIPFLFVTGYGEIGIPARYRDAPRLNKPFDMAAMGKLVARLFGAATTHPG